MGPDGVHVGVVGGGLMGLALAHKLAAAGRRVTVLEREAQVGGLATWHDYGRFCWDRFYHVILPSDRHLIRFVDELGLAESLEWKRTHTGFYVDNHMYSISSNLEFLRFPLLGCVSKMRLAWTMLYASRIDDWRKLEKIPVEDWLVRVSGRETYEKMWKPLLLAKLGENYRRVSAVFIWSYIKRLFSARDSSASREQLGHVSGGYRTILERACERIRQAGGEVRTGVGVRALQPGRGRGVRIETDAGTECYDRVVCTSPVPILRQLAHPSLLDIGSDPHEVEYLGVICVVIVTPRPIVPFYVVNIADRTIPFTGIIGMTNAVSTGNTAGLHLTYLPKYLVASDPLFSQPDADVEQAFLEGLESMLPDFDRAEVISIHVNRAARVQPLQVLDYSTLVPKVRTCHPDFYVLNTAQFVAGTLNNNEVVGCVERFVERYGGELTRPAAAAA